jgi:hypothetical protein
MKSFRPVFLISPLLVWLLDVITDFTVKINQRPPKLRYSATVQLKSNDYAELWQ